jgi:hypothetical protein
MGAGPIVRRVSAHYWAPMAMLDSLGEGCQYIPAATAEALPSHPHQPAQLALWRASGVSGLWAGMGSVRGTRAAVQRVVGMPRRGREGWFWGSGCDMFGAR